MKGVTMMKRVYMSLLSILLIFSVLPFHTSVKAEENFDVELWNVVKPLDTTISFVNVGAHPDDERSDLLAYLSRGLGVDTASLIANRGEGGQNQIGSELFTTLGIIRSMEMQEAAKVNGVAAYHLSETIDDDIYDFGFAKTPEETLEVWGEEVTYERLIRFIRTFRPDIIMPTFRDVASQHGHHRTMSILGVDAFEDAADPSIFPEQLNEGLSVWQPKKVFLPAENEEQTDFSVEIGDYDDIYGMTYPQLGEKSRYLHKSQGMGNDIPAEPRQTHFEIVDEENLVKTNNENPILDGIPANFAEWATLLEDESDLQIAFDNLHDQLQATIAAYPAAESVFTESAIALEDVRTLIEDTKAASIEADLQDELLFKLEVKEAQLQKTNYVASKINVQAEIASNVLTQGQNTTVEVTVTNNGEQKITDAIFTLSTPSDWSVSGAEETYALDPGEEKILTYDVTVPENAAYFEPYAEPVVQVDVGYDLDSVHVNQVENVNDTIAVLPEVSLTATPEELVINTEDVQEEVSVTLRAKNYVNGAAQTTVTLDLPDGWDISPKEQVVDFSEKMEEQDVTFTVTPPQDITEGEFHLDAKASYKGKELTSTIQEIYYDHISESFYQYPAQVKGIAFELNTVEGLKVGYVESGFDEVPDYLRNAGFDITSLTEDDLASGDLSEYDTIVTGIRAYMAREDLVKHNDRLLEYVEKGGHLVVQHNLPAEFDAADPAPYPLKVGRPSIEWRVTDETADVTVLNPDSDLFHFPNEIVENDWDHWIQERGLYFPMEWGEEYEALVSMADPGEEPFEGSMLFTEYGEGSYVYTSLGFYRQIQNQVAGGYRIFANLISYGQEADVELPDEDEVTVKSVASIDEIDVDFGTKEADIDFPKQVDVTLSNDKTVSVPVSWDASEPAYDGKKANAYTFTGTLALADEVINEDNLTATLIVNVLEEKASGNDDDEDNKVDNGDNGSTSPDKDKPDDKTNGEALPKTATTMYSTLLIGLIVLLVGGAGIFFWRKRKAS